MTSSTEDDIIKLDHGSGLYIVMEDGSLLLQRRNRWKNIRNPGKISIFAGKAEKVDMRRAKKIGTPKVRQAGPKIDPVQAHLHRTLNQKFYFINRAQQADFLHEVRTVALRECEEEIEDIWEEHHPDQMLPLTEIDPIFVYENGLFRILSVSMLSHPVKALPSMRRIHEGAGRVALLPGDLERLARADKVSFGTMQAHARAKTWAFYQMQIAKIVGEPPLPVVPLILDPPTGERRVYTGHSLQETLTNLPTPLEQRRQHYDPVL